MSTSIDRVEKELNMLSSEDRELLLQRFFNGQSVIEPSIKEAWAREADRRLDEMLSGKVEGIPAEEVFAEMQRIVGDKDIPFE